MLISSNQTNESIKNTHTKRKTFRLIRCFTWVLILACCWTMLSPAFGLDETQEEPFDPDNIVVEAIPDDSEEPGVTEEEPAVEEVLPQAAPLDRSGGKSAMLAYFAAIQETSVSTYSEFKQALQNGAQVIVIENDIAASELGNTVNDPPPNANNTAVIGGTNATAAISQDFEIRGRTGTETIDMGMYYILLGGSTPTLYVHDIKIKTTSRYIDEGIANRYASGVFQTVNARSAKWTAYFENINYVGACLVGTNAYTATGIYAYFEYVEFSGDNTITVNNYAATSGAIFAQNVTIGGNFRMYDDIDKNSPGTPSTHRRASMQVFFKSPNVSYTHTSQTLETVSYGDFVVTADADVYMYRDSKNSGQGTLDPYHEYYRSLINGYENYYFYEGCTVNLTAGTNRHNGSTGSYPYSGGITDQLSGGRSAVIYSGNCKNFIVGYTPDGSTPSGKKTTVNLTSIPPSANAAYPEYNGWTALFLAKQRSSASDLGDKSNPHLTIYVAEHATLDVKVENTVNHAASTRLHGCSPVYIAGPGSSRTTIAGNLNVWSGRGDGWGYQFNNTTTKFGYQDFIVTETGTANITANNLNGSQGAVEYAAFDAYGNYEVNIRVDKGGVMDVQSKGYRGMSLAGSTHNGTQSAYAAKSIYVEGELRIIGWEWAIAAEVYSVLEITAANGGKIHLQSNAGDESNAGQAGGAPSTVYSVGKANYRALSGGDIYIFHNGGTYSAIYHDGFGPLQIDIESGGMMTVYSLNTMPNGSSSPSQLSDNYRARRSAICAQSTVSSGGGYASSDNYIKVDGVGSSLYVNNNNEYIHSGSDEHYYPTSAISFNNNSSRPTGLANTTASAGSILVANGARFEAINNSQSPTINIHNGTVTFDNPGYFHIRNNAVPESPISLPDYPNRQGNGPIEGHAIYNHGTADRNIPKILTYQDGTSYGPSSNLSVRFVNCDVTVWSAYENQYNYADAYIDNSWKNVTFSADNRLGVYVNPLNQSGQRVQGSGGDNTVYNGYTLALDEFHLSSYGRINGTGSGYSVKFSKYDENNEPLAGAEFVLWRYVQEYVESHFDEATGEYVEAHYRDTDEKEYFYYDAVRNASTWIAQADVLPGYSNITVITTTGETPYNGLLYSSVYGGVSFGGTYYLKEIRAPDGYQLLEEDSSFTIQSPEDVEHGSNTTVVTIRNYPEEIPPPDLGSIKIVKYGDQDEGALSGAMFTIELLLDKQADIWAYIYYDSDSESWETTTDKSLASGTTADAAGLLFEDLPEGTYRVTEVVAPDSADGTPYMLLKEPIIVTIPYDVTYAAGSSETPADGYNEDKTVLHEDGSNTYYYYHLTFTVTDAKGVQLPAAGYFWDVHKLLFFGTLIIAFAILLLFRIGKEEELFEERKEGFHLEI